MQYEPFPNTPSSPSSHNVNGFELSLCFNGTIEIFRPGSDVDFTYKSVSSERLRMEEGLHRRRGEPINISSMRNGASQNGERIRFPGWRKGHNCTRFFVRASLKISLFLFA